MTHVGQVGTTSGYSLWHGQGDDQGPLHPSARLPRVYLSGHTMGGPCTIPISLRRWIPSGGLYNGILRRVWGGWSPMNGGGVPVSPSQSPLAVNPVNKRRGDPCMYSILNLVCRKQHHLLLISLWVLRSMRVASAHRVPMPPTQRGET
jgi:hypothetical protein